MNLAPNPYNLIVPIEDGRKEELLEKLAIIQDDLLGNPLLPFGKIKTIHFARFVVLHKTSDYPDQLAFSTNYDGGLEEHLQEILRCPDADIDQIFAACRGYPTTDEVSKIKWLKDNAQFRPYFYRGTWGLSKEQILRAEQYRQTAEQTVDDLSDQGLSPEALRKSIANAVKGDPDFETYADYTVPRIGFWEALRLIPITIAILVLLPVFLIILLAHEIADDSKQYNKKYSDKDRTRAFVQQEDRIVQNQLTHLVEIKPGWFRLLTLKFVLGGIAYLAKYLYNKGKLGGIPTIPLD